MKTPIIPTQLTNLDICSLILISYQLLNFLRIVLEKGFEDISTKKMRREQVFDVVVSYLGRDHKNEFYGIPTSCRGEYHLLYRGGGFIPICPSPPPLPLSSLSPPPLPLILEPISPLLFILEWTSWGGALLPRTLLRSQKCKSCDIATFWQSQLFNLSFVLNIRKVIISVPRSQFSDIPLIVMDDTCTIVPLQNKFVDPFI